MKTLRIKSKVKYLVAVVLCYVIASLGVNGVINPVYYVQHGDIHNIQMVENEEYLYVDLSQTPQGSYIIFEISDLNSVMNNLSITLLDGEDVIETDTLKMYKGFVSYMVNAGVTGIQIAQKEIQKNELVINQIWFSNIKKVDTLGMIKVFISILCLVVFWDCTQIIKRKYT